MVNWFLNQEETNPVSIIWGIDKWNEIYRNLGMLFCIEKEPQKHVKWKNPDTKDLLLYRFIYMSYPKKATLAESR